MAKKPKTVMPSLEQMSASLDIKKACEDFQTEVQVEEIRKIIGILEDRIALVQSRAPVAATNFIRLAGNLLLQKRLAKCIVRFCFRDNTPLEDMHSDPDSRIGQDEMKALMIAAVQNCYAIVGLLCGEKDDRPDLAAFARYLEMASGSTDLLTALERHDCNPDWDDPRES
jgi:hypothetical protein